MDESEEFFARLYNAFNPLLPATEAEYVETADVRGNAALAPFFLKHLLPSRPAKAYLSLPFSGHIGGGKSSELDHLAFCLRKPHPLTKGKRFLPVKLNVLDYFEDYTASIPEILLAMVSELGDTFRSDPELKTELKDSLIVSRLQELKSFLFSEVDVPEGEVAVGAVKAKFKLLKNDPGRRSQVRRALEREPNQFREAINSVLVESRLTARTKGFEDLVFLIDSLDRIEKTPEETDATAAHKSLFLDSAYVFADLRVHKVLALPLSLVRAHGPQIAPRYGMDPYVLPLVKVEDRHHARYEPGYEAFKDLVRRRVAPTTLKAVFEEPALEHLIRYSGGHPRLLLRFLTESLTESNEILPVDSKAARKALRGTIQTMAPSVRDAWWPKLAALELSAQQRVDGQNPDIQQMLDETMILEYLNGDVEADEFEENAPWFAVHPILRELQSFKASVAEEKAKRNEDEPHDGD